MDKAEAKSRLKFNANKTKGPILQQYIDRVENGVDPFTVLREQRQEEEKQNMLVEMSIITPQRELDPFREDPFYPRPQRRPQFAD